MRRASITIPDELELAIERYRKDLEVSPSLASVVQAALRAYLEERGYLVEGVDGTLEEEDFIPASGPKPGGLADAPRPKSGGNPVSDAVIEDRR